MQGSQVTAKKSQERLRPIAPKSAFAIMVFGLLLLYVPLVVLVTMSFRGPLNGPGSDIGWTLEWYRKLLQNESILAALEQSIFVGFWSALVSTILGTAAALGMERTRFPGRRLFDTLIHVPLIMPEIVMGLSLLIWFVALKITLGTFSIILAHITFSISYVIITVRSRLSGFDESMIEAAKDLGAKPSQIFWRVTMPLIWPGVFSGALMAFTLSFDDFLITFFTAGVGSDTLPLKIYTMIKFGMSPEINALSTCMLSFTLAVILLVFKPFSRQE